MAVVGLVWPVCGSRSADFDDFANIFDLIGRKREENLGDFICRFRSAKIGVRQDGKTRSHISSDSTAIVPSTILLNECLSTMTIYLGHICC